MADHRPREGTDHPREPDREGAGKQPETAPDGEAVSGFPEPPGKDPGDRSQDRDPHHALNNPIEAPDESEWPDPYETRQDPREPPPDDGLGDEPHPPAGASSTSDPHPSQDPEAEPVEAPERDRLDD
jgi:hypothetical protein